jgi:porin
MRSILGVSLGRSTLRATLAALPLLYATAAATAGEVSNPAPEGAAAPAGAEPVQAEAEQSAETRLLGGLGGLRPVLATLGVDLGISYIGETLGSVSGAVKRGPVYDGQLGVSLDVDLDKLAGWRGAKAHVNGFQIQGSGLSADSGLETLSNIEALPTGRLYTLWLEQSLFDGRLSIRAGQLAADAEFIASDTAGGLIDGTFGWPLLTGADTRGGGPAYPLPQPGVRLQIKPAADVTLRGAVFSGNPGGQGCAGNPQVCNPHGVTFSLSGGTLWLAELEYAANTGDDARGLPGTYKLGGWRETGAFPDQLTGVLNRRGDWGGYAVVDQALWRRPGSKDQGVNFFMRVGGAPSDRNVVSWYADGGLGFKAPFAARSDDVLTVGLAYGRISGDAALADRLAGPPTRVRDYVALIEVSYIASLAPGWTIQPDLQYVIHPGGGAASPTGQGRIGNAPVLGFRTTILF